MKKIVQFLSVILLCVAFFNACSKAQLAEGSAQLEEGMGTLEVSSAPKGATILVNGNFFALTPGSEELVPGRYGVHAELEGHAPQDTSVFVTANKVTPVFFNLVSTEVRMSQLAVVTTPEDGADVLLGGVNHGRTPTPFIEVEPEVSHEIIVKKVGFHQERREVTLKPGEEKTLSIELTRLDEPAKTLLSVATDPIGAFVFLDGISFDISNTGFHEVSPDNYDLRIEKQGFVPIDTSFSISDGQRLSLEFKLGRTTVENATVNITSSPSGADVITNKAFFTRTPSGDRIVTPGTYNVTVNKDGYVPQDTSVTLGAGQRFDWHVELQEIETSEPQPPVVEASATPEVLYLPDNVVTLSATADQAGSFAWAAGSRVSVMNPGAATTEATLEDGAGTYYIPVIFTSSETGLTGQAVAEVALMPDTTVCNITGRIWADPPSTAANGLVLIHWRSAGADSAVLRMYASDGETLLSEFPDQPLQMVGPAAVFEIRRSVVFEIEFFRGTCAEPFRVGVTYDP